MDEVIMDHLKLLSMPDRGSRMLEGSGILEPPCSALP